MNVIWVIVGWGRSVLHYNPGSKPNFSLHGKIFKVNINFPVISKARYKKVCPHSMSEIIF